jgi:hypothetical protein
MVRWCGRRHLDELSLTCQPNLKNQALLAFSSSEVRWLPDGQHDEK